MAADVRKQLETMFSVDATEFNQLVKEGVIVKDPERKYNIGSSTYNYIKHLKDKSGTQEVSAQDLADIFGFTDRRRIDQLVNEGVVVKIKRGVFDANKSSQNFIKYLKGDTNSSEDAEALYEASFREAIAKAEQKEEEVRKIKRLNDIEEAVVIPTELLLEFLGPLTGQINRSLDGLVIEFRREFEQEFNAALERRIVDSINTCKKGLANAHLSVLAEIEKTQDELASARGVKQQQQQQHVPGTTPAPKAIT